MLYSHDGFGLGHVRIVLAVAGALAERRPDAALLALTGSLQTHAYELPPNLDYVKLPSFHKRALFRGLPPVTPGAGALHNIHALREALIQAAIDAYRPRLVVVDHAPVGLFRELNRVLPRLRAAKPRVELVLLLRDITFGPAQTREIWTSEGAYESLERIYDRVLVYGSRDIFDPVREYGLSPAVAAKTTFCGYLRPPVPRIPAGIVRDRIGAGNAPLAVVTVGGGADGSDLLRAYLAGLREGAPGGLVSYVVTGPLLDETERGELERAAVGLPHVTLVPFCADLVSYLHAADVVVTMGGYNAICEAVDAGKRPIVVPRPPGSEEQLIRAQRFAAHDLVTVLLPAELTADRLRRAVEEELRRGFSPAPRLDFGGLPCIGDELAALLPR